MSKACCLLCEQAPYHRFRISDYDIVRCEHCDLEWVYPTPSADTIAAVYASNYFQGEGAGYRSYFEAERASNLRKSEHRLRVLRELGASEGGRWLDVGAADGTFVNAALEAGFDAYGVEISAEAIEAASPEARERLLPSLEHAVDTGLFDVITLWDVLEHLPDVPGTLNRVSAALVKGGLCAIVVPVIDNWNARHKPESWDQYKPPEHLTFFSTRSLRLTLERWIGRVVFEETAWSRLGRRFGIGDQPQLPRRALATLEKGLSKALQQLRLVKPSRFLDSVLMVAQRD